MTTNTNEMSLRKTEFSKAIQCFVVLFVAFALPSEGQGIAVNATGSVPDTSAILDVASTSKGFLPPRMTTAQRNAISLPANGLQVYNITTSTIDVYRVNHWESTSVTQPGTNLVYVDSLNDLPTPSGNAITLNATKMYIFSGIVDISPNYLNLNGAGLRGMDPGKDGIMSSVTGAVLRSTGVSVYMESLMVIPASASTKAYDFADATGVQFCNLFSGCSVIDAVTPSLGVGQISGFNCTTISKNYWKCKDGIKLSGTVGKFAAVLNYITGISDGSAIEFLPGLIVSDIDLSNNYFVYTGQTGVKLTAGAIIDIGRMTTNMFRGVTAPLSGFDSYTPGWVMLGNSGVPDSRTFAYAYMNANTTTTATTTTNTFVKVAGTTSTTVLQKMSAPASNRLTYIGKKQVNARVLIILSGTSPNTSGAVSVALAKNGTIITVPYASLSGMGNNQNFQLVLETEVTLNSNDYIEVFIANNNGTLPYLIKDMQFRIIE